MDKGAIVRTAVLVIALINQVLVATGLNPISGSEDVWGEAISSAITVGAAVWAWFKDNAVTARGKYQQQVLKDKGLK
ncbi:holin, SPP1 family [Gracilibacillus orientalis]|uniref:Holin, SPP1 family n=1 Tax=Gracilibacillus orientalis TaxID=334253 RepID=A0A1I4Q8T2_9BACI|nr:phage holin [Gracilibacillus orientalis]SFM36454.1 holin, SPP1 family [Gracilibacillus orientalis]